MNKKIKVVVLMGGKSPEHEVSLLSGQQVVKNIDKENYEVLPIVISKTGNWQLTSKTSILQLENPLDLKGTSNEIILLNKKEVVSQTFSKEMDVDVFFIAMHGPNGEDGVMQGMLELMGVTYTGSGVLASALGMDKLRFRQVMESVGIPVPKYRYFNKLNYKKIIKSLKKFPYFVKPNDQGSSVGASIALNVNQLMKSVRLAFEYSDIVLVDEYIKGRELTCAVIGNDDPIPLPIIEIIPKKGEFFDYESKYTESGADEIVPAKMSKATEKRIKELAVNTYNAIGCRGFGRVDFLLRGNEIFVLEINTIPGLTPTSLLPKAAASAGMTYTKLLDKIIKLALTK